MTDAYAKAGVNLELGDDVSRILYEAAKVTWENRKGKLGEIVELSENFSGLRGIHVGSLPADAVQSLSFDGVGTKIEIAERHEKHDTVAFDLFAMVCDDAVRFGAEPVLVGSILDVRALGEKREDNTEVSYIDFVKQLAVGYIGAAKAAGIAVVNGEVAELGARVQGYGPFNYNWGAGVLWFARGERLITGKDIQPRDVIIGLREEGFRSNGLSLVRKILKQRCGENWHMTLYNNESLGDLALHPSCIYSAAVVDVLGGFAGEPKAEVHGIAHITGGGVPGKLGRVLKPTGLGAALEELFAPCNLMRYCQQAGSVPDEEAYKTWNMGQGMVVITPEPENVIGVVQAHGIEAKIVGEITATPGIRIKSRGYFYSGKELVF